MNNLRKYGHSPYQVSVIHGGPGAAGEMAQVAKELSSKFGVLEPLQTKNTIDLQVSELKKTIEDNSDFPITLIGYSWGAWLAFIFTAQYPSLVKKLILVSSGPFEDKFAKGIMSTRLMRLSEQKRKELTNLRQNLDKSSGLEKDRVFQKIGKIISTADSYKPMPHQETPVQAEIYESVWPEAEQLRKSGKLLSYAEKIVVPVVAIHGSYDPHPDEGVKKPLNSNLKIFKFILLNKCGHTPWIEKEAKDKFFEILFKELE